MMADNRLLSYITDRTAFGPDEPTRRRCLLEKIVEAARAGVDYIQLREKDLSTRQLESLAREAVAILEKLRTENRELKTKLLINSRTDVALASGADGMHLRSDDISPRDARLICTKALVVTAALGCPAQSAAAHPAPSSAGRAHFPLIGISCHSPQEVLQAAADGANFAVFAPVFEKTDAPGTQPAGLTQLREACKAKIPVLALGGVHLANAKQCLEAGAAGIAAIRLFQENKVAAVVAQLHSL